MPYSPDTIKSKASGAVKDAAATEIVNLFGFVGLHEMAAAVEPVLARAGQRGRRSPYPAVVLLAMLVAARVTGSISSAVAALAEPDLWQRCTRAYYRRAGEGATLPDRAPDRHAVNYFKQLITANEEHLRRISAQFTVLAVGQAQRLGNFASTAAPDLTSPDPTHCIYADGTVIKPYSDVTLWTHPSTGEVIARGSRAKSLESAIYQKEFSNTRADGKDLRGLNMVAVHTWTKAGRVVLATGKAMGAEQWTALDLIDTIVATLRRRNNGVPGQVHGLIYDRAITGWNVDYLMGAHGIQTYGKAVSRTSGDSAGSDLETRTTREVATYGIPLNDTKRNRTADLAMARKAVKEDQLDAVRDLPLGLCYYPTTSDSDRIHSWYQELQPLVHDTPAGPCTHRIAVDDGALFLIADDIYGGTLPVKIRALSCRESRRRRGADGKWSVTHSYTVPCSHGPFEHTRTWTPTGTRFTPDSAETDRSPQDKIGWRLRPLNRADDVLPFYNEGVPLKELRRRGHKGPFSQLHGRRNDAESYNHWYQSSLHNQGRAASQSVAAQELDFVLGALLNNSRTWAHHHAR